MAGRQKIYGGDTKFGRGGKNSLRGGKKVASKKKFVVKKGIYESSIGGGNLIVNQRLVKQRLEFATFITY